MSLRDYRKVLLEQGTKQFWRVYKRQELTYRIQRDCWWIYFTIFYIPIGLLLLVVRLCISLQAFLLLLLLPNEFPLKRQVQ